jgi:iron(III) transport system permease protein
MTSTAPSLERPGGPPGTAARLRRLRRVLTPFTILSALVALFMAALALYPLGTVVVRAFYSDGQIDLSPIRRTLEEPGLGKLIVNTLIVVAASTAIALVVGSALAWVNERTDARMGLLTESLPLIPFLLPPVAGATAWVLLLSPGAGFVNVWIRSFLERFGIERFDGPLNIYSWYGLILVYTIYQVPYAFMLVSAGLRNLDPSLEEQSRVSGAGLVRTLRRVTLPGVTPSIMGAVLLMVWSGFGLVSIPLVIGTGANIHVLSERIVHVLTFTFPPDTGLAIGLSMIVIVFVGLAWWAQTKVVRSARFAGVGGKGQRATPIRLGAWRWPVRSLVVLYMGVTTILPIFALVIVSLEGFWTADIPWGDLTLDAYRVGILDEPTTRDALLNSLKLGVMGATIGIVAAAIVSLFVVRTNPRVGRVVDGAIKLPATLSHIVIAVGFVLALSGEPFNLGGSIVILLLAYLALYFPQTAVAADAAVGQVGKELPEASRVAGASDAKTFRRIYLPLMLPGLAAGWALLFVRCVGDLTASAILAGPGNPVVGWKILQVYTDGLYSEMAALATILTLLSGTVVVLVLTLARRRTRHTLHIRATAT